MATTKDFIDYACEQVLGAGQITNKKMFGDYMIYCNSKPCLLVCDNVVFVKQLPETTELFNKHNKVINTDCPYQGAKLHYILDIEDQDFATDMVKLLERIIPTPKPRKKKNVGGPGGT